MTLSDEHRAYLEAYLQRGTCPKHGRFEVEGGVCPHCIVDDYEKHRRERTDAAVALLREARGDLVQEAGAESGALYCFRCEGPSYPVGTPALHRPDCLVGRIDALLAGGKETDDG